MHATVLLILCDGHKSLEVCHDLAHAWSDLVAFVDERWEERYAPALPPADEAQRVHMFFRKGEHYFLATADLTELANTVPDEMPTSD